MESSLLESFPTNLVGSNPRTASNRKSKLPHNFLPSCHSVICGHGGKASSSSPGNNRLKKIVNGYFKPYSEARQKVEKTAIVSSIVGSIKRAAPNGAFVKCEGGMWWEVEDSVAREKVGGMLRGSLHNQYRSSSKAKLARRRAQNNVTGDVQSLKFPLSSTSIINEPKPEHQPSCLPIPYVYANSPLHQSRVSFGSRSSNVNAFRHNTPKPAHLDIMRSSPTQEDTSFFNMEGCSSITPRASMQQTFDGLAFIEDDIDMDDDMTYLFDYSVREDL
jgi:hypothetical protein